MSIRGAAGIWSLAAAIAQPIFAGGKLEAGINVAEARERQALAQYQLAIQTAFKEVRSAILGQTKMRERFEAEERRVIALRQALHLARLQKGYFTMILPTIPASKWPGSRHA